MALVIADRVKETTTTTGTGTINLAGASSGFQTFASGVGNNNTTYYTIEDANGSWEIGIGTVTDSSPDTLARTTVLATSNGDTTKITLSSGTHTVFGTYAAGKAVYLDASGVLSHSIVDADISGSASIANSKLANSSVNFGGVSLSLGGSDTTPAFDLSDATNYPTSSLSGTITNAQLAGSITNAKLANDSVSFGGITVALGASDATPAFDLSDATNYPTSSLSGTITNTQLAGSIANAKLANSAITVAVGSDSTAISLGGTMTFAGTANEVEVSESSGTVTIGLPNNVTIAGTLTVDSVGITAVQTSAQSFANNDTSIMTSAAIEDKILSYSYSDTTGTVTSVAITGTDGIQVDSGSPITSSGTITLGLSGIANDKLANSSVSFGGVSVALGASDDTPAFDLADATNYPTSSLSGTITNAQLAGSIANAKLSNSSITVSDGSSTTAVSLGGTITFSGTANEVEVGESSGTITIGLPSSITANVTGNVTGNTSGSSGSCTGNAATATKLAATVDINGVAFDGSGDITITAAGSTLSDTVTVGKGGTGATSLTDGGVLLGSGTDAVTAMAVLADGEIIVGDGSTDPVALAAFSSSTGTLKVANGGTGLTSIATLLNSNVTPTSLGLVIGTNVQAYDAQLATLAGLTADQVAGLADLAALEAPASDGQFIVATGAGAFAYESGATVRTSLGLGSIATLSSIDISANTNLAGGTGITLTGDTLSTTDSEIVHDNLSGFVANEHIDHSGVSVTAGTGLTGGGTIASTRTLSVDINGTADLASPAVADELLISDADDSNTVKKADLASIVNLADHDALTNFVANEHVDHSSVSITTGTGLSGGGDLTSTRTLSVDASQTQITAVGDLDGGSITSGFGNIDNGSSSIACGSLDVSDGNITNVGDIDCDSISVADAANGLNVDLSGANTGTGKITLKDNVASALDITESSNSYMKFNTQDAGTEVTYSKEAVEISKPLKCTKAIHSSISKTNAVATSQSLKGGGTGNVVTLDLAEAGFFRVQLDNNVDEIWFKNQAEGQKVIIRFEQDGTGSRTVDFSAFYATDGTAVSVNFPGGTAPTLTTTASKADIIGFLNFGIPAGSVHYYNAVVVGQNFSQ